MQPENELVSDVTTFSKYSRYWAELGRRETYEESVARNREMHVEHVSTLPTVADRGKALGLIDEAYPYIFRREVFPSMRSLQFGGEPIRRANNRMYNCGYRFANEPSFFSDLMLLLLGGTGVGYSVQRQHVAQLPPVVDPNGVVAFPVEDSIEGWGGAVEALANAYLQGYPRPAFDYSQIRPKGAILVTSGGKAPGPAPLRATLEDLEDYLRSAIGRQLRPIEVHDMATVVARSVLSGGIRRSAMISLFSPDDEEMLAAKSGAWFERHPDRAFANNSAILLRGRDDHLFREVFKHARESGAGEPGVFWVDDLRYGTNPCSEITLNHKQMCNLTTMNVGTVVDQEDFNNRARAAAIIGTLQASYTSFPSLSPGWEEQTRSEALLGVSMTGIASGAIDQLDAAEAAAHAVVANQEAAQVLGINPAARVTTVKPEGTASLVAGTSSGIHAWHDQHYVRRMRFNRDEPIASYLLSRLPYREDVDDDDQVELLEPDLYNDHQIVVAFPQAAPAGAVTRDEGALALLERIKRYHAEWVRPGNVYGGMTNNISATINVRPDEWDEVERWMWNNRYEYNGLSVLPHSEHSYRQAPFQSISEAKYHELVARLKAADVDLTEVDERDDWTDHSGVVACAGGACELPDWAAA